MSLTSQVPAAASDERAVLFKQITSALKDGSLELPSLPDIALEVRHVATERDLGLSDLARVIQQDPGLSAYLIKISNSVYYARSQPATSLSAAIARLGIDGTRDLASSYAIRTLFFLKDPTIKGYMREVWRRSVHTAAVSQIIARRCGLAADKALIGGLFLDIGALPLLTELKAFPALLANREEVDDLLHRYAGKISGLILNAWGFESALVLAGLDRENWYRDRQPRPELADLVLVARYHTYLEEGLSRHLPPLADLPAFRKLNLGEQGPEQGLLFLKEAREELEALRDVLL